MSTKAPAEPAIEPKWVHYTTGPLLKHEKPEHQLTTYLPIPDVENQVGAGRSEVNDQFTLEEAATANGENKATGVHPPEGVKKGSLKRPINPNWIPYQPGPKRKRGLRKDKPVPIVPKPLAVQGTQAQVSIFTIIQNISTTNRGQAHEFYLQRCGCRSNCGSQACCLPGF